MSLWEVVDVVQKQSSPPFDWWSPAIALFAVAVAVVSYVRSGRLRGAAFSMRVEVIADATIGSQFVLVLKNTGEGAAKHVRLRLTADPRNVLADTYSWAFIGPGEEVRVRLSVLGDTSAGGGYWYRFVEKSGRTFAMVTWLPPFGWRERQSLRKPEGVDDLAWSLGTAA